MASNSRILTVSYGTFSCTLEGFDDPFGTMQSIAEYFRDLAADDRYFGAEPPTPDADVLHRIAERQIQQRVEARVESDGVVLRPEDAPLGVGTAPLAAASLLAQDGPEVPSVDENDAQQEPEPEPEPEAPAAKQADDAILQPETQTASEQTAPASPHPDLHHEDMIDEPADAPDADVETHETELNDTPDDLDVASFFNGDAAAQDETRDETSPIPPVDAAVVQDATAEDHAQQVNQDETNAPLILTAQDSRPTDTDEDVDAILSQLNAQDRTASYEEDAFNAANLPAEDLDDTAPLRPIGRVVRVKRLRRDPDSRTVEAASSDLSEIDDATILDDISNDPDTSATDDMGDGAEHSEKLLGLIDHEVQTEARRERREQVFDHGAADQSEQTLKRILDETKDQMESQEASRRRSSINHMKAAVQARLADADDAAPRQDKPDEQAAYREDLNRAVSPRRPIAPSKTPERLRLAPLVLVSEQRVDDNAPHLGDADAKPKVNAARVRPRRVTRKPGTKAKTIAKTDPFQTVSADPAMDEFAAYVNGADASDMTGLMASAATYATKVQGMEQFSRPHVMRLVVGLNVNGGISREEALRAFGQLLRQGRIRKVAPGRFALVADDDSDRQTA